MTGCLFLKEGQDFKIFSTYQRETSHFWESEKIWFTQNLRIYKKLKKPLCPELPW